MPHKLPFRIVYASSQDEDFPAIELNHHAPTTKGWISSRFCNFPQRLILALQERSKIKKIQILCHQCLISSKVEFFVGETNEGDLKQYDSANYNLLGYVSLSDNNSTEFKARELKSVHVDTHGCYIQLVLHKNYQNVHNLYNQVSLIAVNLIGEDSRTMRATEHGLVVLRPDFVPPTEDLAFDIYQDPEVASIIRRLEKQKLTAVTEERFDQAQKIRDATTYLQRVGERLGRLVVEKEQAVAVENYERAKLKKFQINEIRHNLYRDLDLVQLLAGGSPTSMEPVPPADKSVSEALSTGPRTVAVPTAESIDNRVVVRDPDERPVPTLKNHGHSGETAAGGNNNALIECEKLGDKQLARQLSDALLETDVVVHERSHRKGSPAGHRHHSPLHSPHGRCHPEPDGPLLSKAMTSVLEPTPSTTEVMLDQPEPLSEANRLVAGVAIDVVGIDMVTKALSKSWVFREKALLELEQRVTQQKLIPSASAVDTADIPDPRAELRSTTFLLKRALNDQVLSLFRLATTLIKCAVLDFAEGHDLPRADLFYAFDALIPILFHRTGDTSIRIREIAKAQILTMAQWSQLRQCSSLWNEFVRPFSSITLDRLALSRVELVTDLYAARGVDPPTASSPTDNHGFTLDAVATFTARALAHRLSEVRDAAENLMVALFRAENRAVVRHALPPDDINSRRHPLYRRLFAKFDRIDGQRLPDDTESRIPHVNSSSTLKKRGDVNTLHAEVQRLRVMVNNTDTSKQSRSKRATKNVSKSRSRGMQQSSQSGRLTAPKEPKFASRKSVSKGPTPVLHSDKTDAVKPSSPISTSPELPESSTVVQNEAPLVDAELLLSLDRTCIFCGEHNDAFTEECLDLHYWKDCPMLYRCANCKQVVEVASMTDHLLSECEASPTGRYQRCPRCLEAVISDLLVSHSCVPTNCDCIRCPLCHKNIPVGVDQNTLSSPLPSGVSVTEELWKAHLLGTGRPDIPACPSNPRLATRTPTTWPDVKLDSPKKSPKSRSMEKFNGFSTPASHVHQAYSSDASRGTSTPASHNRSCIPRPTHPNYVRPV